MGLPQTGPEVVVDGRWLTSVAPGWGDLKIVDRWGATGGGCWEATWTVPVNRLRRHQALLARKRVRVYVGSWCRWSGYMSEPNWDTGEMVALGSVRKATEALCLDGSTGQTTSVPDTAIDQAIAAGFVDWVRRSSFSAAAYSGGDGRTDRLNYLGPLLDADATRQNVGWGVNARDEVYIAPPATTPTLLIAPESGVLGLADDTMAGSVTGRFRNSATGQLANTTVGAGGPQIGVDLASKNPAMTEPAARAMLTAMRDQLGARPGWTNSIEVAGSQVTNPGGARTPLALIRADGRQVARLQGVRDERGLDAGTNFVLGETTWDVAEGTVLAAPVGMVGRDLGSIIEDGGGAVLS